MREAWWHIDMPSDSMSANHICVYLFCFCSTVAHVILRDGDVEVANLPTLVTLPKRHEIQKPSKFKREISFYSVVGLLETIDASKAVCRYVTNKVTI